MSLDNEQHIILEQLTNVAREIAAKVERSRVFVYADAIPGTSLDISEDLVEKVIYVTRTSGEAQTQEQIGHNFLPVPNVRLSRSDQVKIAVFLALSKGMIQREDLVLFLTGTVDSCMFDSLVVIDVTKEFEMLTSGREKDPLPKGIKPEVMERVINLASDLGSEGREGKPVGTMFVLGDTERVLALSRQLILNPLRGYEENERQILDTEFEETVKEFAVIDGAFIVRGDGVVESCGTYIKTTGQEEYEMSRGLGSRHHSAAGITAVTDSIAVTVSESTGTVMIFRNGRNITSIEKPRSR